MCIFLLEMKSAVCYDISNSQVKITPACLISCCEKGRRFCESSREGDKGPMQEVPGTAASDKICLLR